MQYIGIDPGTTVSGVVIWSDVDHKVVWTDGKIENDVLLNWLRRCYWLNYGTCTALIVEALSPRGMSLDRNTMATIKLTGRLEEIGHNSTLETILMERDVIKRELLGRTNLPGADSKIRSLLVDEAGPKGTKKEPGPTFGVSNHAWQALGAVWAWMQQKRESATSERIQQGLQRQGGAR